MGSVPESGGGDRAPGGRGRPKDLAKRTAIIRAAQSLFTREGLDSVSMDAIAAAAGVSKRTVYNHFGDKESLFESAVDAEGERLLSPLAGPTADVEDIRRRLCRSGTAALEMLSKPETHEFGRLMISQATRHADQIARFYKAGPEAMQRDLEALLRDATEAGQLAVPDPALAADQLQSMWLGQHHFRQQLGLDGPRTREQIVDHVGRCVEMFLRAYAPDGPEPPRGD